MATIQAIKNNANTDIRVKVAINSIDQDNVADRTDDVADELLVRGVANVADTTALQLLVGDNYRTAIVKDNGTFEWLVAGSVDLVDVFPATGGGVWSRVLSDGTFVGAFNGVSLDPVDGRVILGQAVGEAGNPAIFQDDREIPMAAQILTFQHTTSSVKVKIGPLLSGRYPLQVQGITGRQPGLWLRNEDAATYKDWLWEGTLNDTGRLELSDSSGLLMFINRNLASMSTHLHCLQKVADITSTTGLTLAVYRARHVLTNRGAGAGIALTLPAGLAIGAEFTFTQVNEFPITITANTGQTIRAGTLITGAAGSIVSTHAGCSIRLQYMVSAAEWQAIALVGMWGTA